MMVERLWVVIAYDIPDDRRRLQVAAALEAYLERVQYSLFEGPITPANLQRLLKRLARRVDPAADSVRVYRLCRRCQAEVRDVGRTRLLGRPPVIVV